jgi:multidrug efflux system membrane fusion protein
MCKGAHVLRRVLTVLVVLLLLGGVGALTAWRLNSTPSGEARGRGDAPVPVRVAAAAHRDVPIYVEALGTVTPLATALVHARVEGVLERFTFEEGALVQEGQVLAELDARPFRVAAQQADAAFARDHAQAELARANLVRGRQLHATGLMAQQELETLEAAAAQLSASERASRAGLEAARLQLSYAHVTSPITGLTGLRQVDPGNLVRPSDANGLVVVTAIDPISIVFSIPEDLLGDVRTAMSARALTVEVRSRDGANTLAEGTLQVVDNHIDGETASVRLRAQMENDARALWPQQLVQVRVLLETRQGALVVPDAAVQQGPEGPFVYVVQGETASVRAVVIERTSGQEVILRSGLSEGDQVVVEGQSRLREGATVALPGARPEGRRGARP